MIKLQDGTILDNNQYTIKEQFDGINYLTFTLPEDVVVHNEDVVFETIDRQEYVVKIINGDYITCELNLDGLKAQQTDFSNNSATAGNTLTQALSGTGWTGIDQTGLTSKKTISGALTPFDIIQKIAETWDGVTALYNTEQKTVTLVFPALNTATVTFLTEDLNLRQLDIAGDSSKFCTRIRAEGANGITFASINCGKDYVENYSYSNKIVYGEKIVDNRFTDAQSLLALNADIDRYVHEHNLLLAPNFVKVFFKYAPDHEVEQMTQRLEQVIEDLSNTKDRQLLAALNDYPFMTERSHTRPFERRWLNVLAALVVPLGLFLYLRMWHFRLRLLRDFRLVRKLNEQVVARIEDMNK